MTREVMGADSNPSDERPAPIVDIDLGELEHLPARGEREPRIPLSERVEQLSQRWREVGWRVTVAIVVVAVCAAAVGWQASANRSRTTAAEQPSTKPLILAWLSYEGVDPGSQAGLPNATLQVHLANFGPNTLELSSVTSTVDSGSVTAQLLPGQPVQIAAGQTTTTAVQIHANCVSDYGHAALHFGVRPLTGSSGPHGTVDPVSDPQLGESYLNILNQLCANGGEGSGGGGVNAVYFEQESDSTGATIILDNRARGVRRIAFSAADSDGFVLHTSPSGTQVMQPGQSISIRLTVSVTSCRAAGRLSNWAQTVNLTVKNSTTDDDSLADQSAPAEMGIGDAILAPLGAAVVRACS
jgi:hypothetical protein